MKAIILSDLHGYLPILPDFDLLLIGGDSCPTTNHSRQYQREWLGKDFAEWVNSLNYRDSYSRVVMIAGNHDLGLENISSAAKKEWLSKIKDNRLVYLDNELYAFNYFEADEPKEVTIFGCPYCKVFGNWAFMRENLEKYYSVIPEGVDILLTHDAADINNLGTIQMGAYAGENAGNKLLAEHVKRVHPKYYFCGHIHSGNHNLKEVDGIKMANVSIMDEYYRPTHNPLVLDYEEVDGVVYLLLGKYERKIEDGGTIEKGTDVIGVFSTHEKALDTQKGVEKMNPQPGYCYTSFYIQSNIII